MAIVIKEIILSDTLEKFMEKVNFNFDQLMLAGGGPQGPQGPIGPLGPIGPKGDQGNKWYVGCTGTTAAIGATLYEGDLFLQKGSCIGATYPLGQVLSFNETTEIFVDTGLNLRGPTGPTGPTGADNTWAVYPGYTAGSIWNGNSVEGSPGATPSFVLLKGDAFGSTGLAQHPEYSRDTLYLGGFRGMSNQAQVYSLNRLPKLFVSPKTIMNSTQFFGATGGFAGSGIALVREPSKSGGVYTPINPSSYSNIFIDDEMNLNITNFSDYTGAITIDSLVTNDINLMSKRGIKLIGGHYDYAQASSIGEFSSELQSINASDSNNVFKAAAGGFNLIQKNNEGLGQIELLGNVSQLRVFANRTSIQTDYPDVAFWLNNSTPNISDVFRIGIGAHTNFKNATFQKDKMPFIGAGWLDTTTNYPYIGFGTQPGAGGKPKLFLTGNKVVIGTPGTYPVADLGSLQSNSIDITGQLRMRYTSGTTGQVMVSVDAKGTAEWVNADQIGAWKNDPSCSTQIEISNRSTRFASFKPGSGSNYTRVDFPSLGPNDEQHQTDLYLGNYNEDGYTTIQGHIISKQYTDANGYGFLSISTGILKPCPTDITSRQLETGSTKRDRLSIGAYGEIIIGTTAPINNPNGTTLLNGLSQDSLKIYSGLTEEAFSYGMNGGIHLININSPLTNNLIKFTPNPTANGTREGYNSTTSIEILRTYGGNNSGPGNIRFLGVGKSSKTGNTSSDNGVPSSTSTGRGSTNSIGSHVMMISDVDFKNKYDETGKTYDYYELNHHDFYVDTVAMSIVPQSVAEPSTPFNEGDANAEGLVHHVKTLHEWGTVSSGWDSGPWGYDKFNGSRSANFFGGASDSSPAGFNFGKRTTNDTITGRVPSGNFLSQPGIDTNSADALVVWNSPASGVRFSPMNLNVPKNGKGLSFVDFNIDIGMIAEVENPSANVSSSADQNYTGLIAGPGQNNGNGLSVRTGASPLVRYLRIKLKSGANSGIASLIDNLDYTRRNSIVNGTNPASSKNQPTTDPASASAVYYTDWYVGQCKPLYGNGSYALNTPQTPQKNIRYAPLTSGVERFYQVSGDEGANRVIKPFINTIASVWTSPNDKLWEFSQLAYSKIFLAGLNNSDYSGRFQVSRFMWRVYVEYPSGFTTNPTPQSPTASYIEIAFVESPGDYALSSGMIWMDGSKYSASIDNNMRIEMQEGIRPIMPIMLSQNWDTALFGGTSKKYWDLDFAMNFINRSTDFYTSHGFSLSGQAILKWNNQLSTWQDQQANDDDDNED